MIRRAADVAFRRRFRLLLTRQESLLAAIKAASSSCDLPPFLLVSSPFPSRDSLFISLPAAACVNLLLLRFISEHTWNLVGSLFLRRGPRLNRVTIKQTTRRATLKNKDCCEVSKAHCELVVVLIWAGFFFFFSPRMAEKDRQVWSSSGEEWFCMQN